MKAEVRKLREERRPSKPRCLRLETRGPQPLMVAFIDDALPMPRGRVAEHCCQVAVHGPNSQSVCGRRVAIHGDVAGTMHIELGLVPVSMPFDELQAGVRCH